MIESFLGMLRKRRRVDGEPETTTSQSSTSKSNRTATQIESESQSPSPHPPSHLYSILNDDECLLRMQINDSDSDLGQLRGLNHSQLATIDRPFNLNERFVGVLDQLDARVEKFRKDAMGLQEKRDFLLMSIDLIKTNDLLQGMNEAEREEISCYIQRVNSRLSTVELNVRTVRDTSQEDSLSQINMLIDMMITLGDPVLSRQRCQQYLNACSSSDGSNNMGSYSEHGGANNQDVIVDKKFECALLGCTLDDQKNVKKRLQALMGYLNKQTIRE